MSRQEVTVFAIQGGVCRYGGQAFFDKCLSLHNRIAASSYMPPTGMKMAAFDFSKAAISRQARENASAVRRLFSFAVVRQFKALSYLWSDCFPFVW